MRSLRIFRVWSLCLGLTLIAAPSIAQNPPHLIVRDNLVYLTLTGAPTIGNLVGQPDGVQSQATGFFVGNEGFILTAEHFFDPATAVKAVNLVIQAELSGPGGAKWPVSFVSALPDVDLVLLRANIPFGTAPPAGLELGQTAPLTVADDRDFLTSGFNGEDYVPDDGKLIERGNRKVPFAWTLKLAVGGGQSGSPVYIEDEAGGVKVVGVVKATTGANNDRTLMVPIEYSMPLIGHFRIAVLEAKVARIDALERQVARLTKLVGEISDQQPPIGDRINFIEEDVDQIGRFFTWKAETAPDGSIRIRYSKLVGGEDQIDRIQVFLGAKALTLDEQGEDVVPAFAKMLKLNQNGNLFDRVQLDAKGLKGDFTIPGVHAALSSELNTTFNAKGGDKPFANLELVVVPFIRDEKLEAIPMTLAANYDFNLQN